MNAIRHTSTIPVACQYISTYINLTLLRQTVSIILNRFGTLLVEGTISDSPVLSQPEELRNPLHNPSNQTPEDSFLFLSQPSTVASQFNDSPALRPPGRGGE
jgi:hypothetical protein